MLLQPHPPTDALRETLVALLTNGVPSLDLDPPFPGVAIYQDDVPEEAVAPFLLVDCTDSPVPHGKTQLWRHTIRISLTQPVEVPTDPAVDPDYDVAQAGEYEANLHALITGRLPKPGVAYDAGDRSTFRVLSDLLALTATGLGNLFLVTDSWALHRPDCATAGLPVRQKLATATEQELEYEFVLVCGLEDVWTWALDFAPYLDGAFLLAENVQAWRQPEGEAAVLLEEMLSGQPVLDALAAILDPAITLSRTGTVITFRIPASLGPELITSSAWPIAYFYSPGGAETVTVGIPS